MITGKGSQVTPKGVGQTSEGEQMSFRQFRAQLLFSREAFPTKTGGIGQPAPNGALKVLAVARLAQGLGRSL